jgi:hypothetical protein
MGRALYHLAVADALRHHFCCPYSCLELLGPEIRLEPGEVLVVRLGRSGVVVAEKTKKKKKMKNSIIVIYCINVK